MSPFFLALIIGLCQTLLLITALVKKQDSRNSALIILLSIIAFGLTMRIGLTHSFYTRWPRLIQLADLAIFACGPCFLLFFKSTRTTIFYDKWQSQWHHIIPVLLFLTHYCVYILPLSTQEFLQTEANGGFNTYYSALLGCGLFINITYWLGALRDFKKHHNKDLVAHKLLRILLALNGVILTSWLVAFSSSILKPTDMVLMNQSYQISFLTLALSTILISYQALTRSDFWHQPQKRQKYNNSSLSQEQLSEWAQRLRLHMSSEKAYLNPSLTLDDLSKALNINKVMLSQVINQSFGMGFSDWINEFRVLEFIDRADSEAYSHFTFIGIATDCGFNNKVTFNKAFKKSKGQTPTDFFRVRKLAQQTTK